MFLVKSNKKEMRDKLKNRIVMEGYHRMIKIETNGEIFLIERNDLEAGIKELRKRRGIVVFSNGIYRLNDIEGVLLYIGIGKKFSIEFLTI